MRSGRLIGKMLLLLIALAACALDSPKQQVRRDSPLNQPTLQFGQSSLSDGVGRFERASAQYYAGRFESGGETLTAPDESSQETIDPGEGGSDQIVTSVSSPPPGSVVLIGHQSSASVSSGADQRPSQRGPPLVLI